MKITSVLFLAVLLFSCAKEKQKETNIYQWRGDNRDGVYNETGLMKKWSESGLPELWYCEGIGNGYGSPVVSDSMVYVTGEIDSTSYLFAIDLQGQIKWKTAFGQEWTKSFQGSRSAPTVVDSCVYVANGMGIVACIAAQDGKILWSVDMIKDLHGRNNYFGLSESLLVDEQYVYCTTGGVDTNVVALDHKTGSLVWKCKGIGEIAAYSSPKMIKLATRNLLVTFTKFALLGIDAKTGQLLWSHKQDKIGESNVEVHCNTPLYDNGFIYYVTGDGNGAVKLKLSDDGSQITQVWRNQAFDNVMGGVVKFGDFLYGSGHEKKVWYKVDANTGDIRDSLAFGRGATILADSMLYCYNETGALGLVNPSLDSLKVISTSKVERGTKEHFSHPVISNGVLYVRHGNTLIAYNVKKS